MKNKLLQLIQSNLSKPKALTVQNMDGDEGVKVYLYDVIDRWYGISAEVFVRELQAIDAEVIHLHINSPGGDIFEARTMKTALEQHSAKVVVHIDGLAASAATFIACAGDEIEISEGGFYMIHNSWSFTVGNRHDHMSTASLLEKVDASIVTDYAKRTGVSTEQLQQWMDDETWFEASEALEHGFVDSVYEASLAQNSFDVSAYDNAPAALLQASVDELEHPDWELANRRLSLMELNA